MTMDFGQPRPKKVTKINQNDINKAKDLIKFYDDLARSGTDIDKYNFGISVGIAVALSVIGVKNLEDSIQWKL